MPKNLPQVILKLCIISAYIAPQLPSHAGAAASLTPSCRAEGPFQPSTLKGPPADSGGLAICHNFSKCSCCSHATSAIIFNSIKEILTDPGFSERCKRFITLISCRICDPLVGIGQKPTVCRNLCNGWYDRCIDEFFAFQATTGRLVPCVSSGQETLLCTQMREIAKNGSALCTIAGLTVSDNLSQCYDGIHAPMLDSCHPGATPPSSIRSTVSRLLGKPNRNSDLRSSRNQSKKGAKAKKKRAAGAKYSTADLVLLVLAVSLATYCSRSWLLRSGWHTNLMFPGVGQRLGTALGTTEVEERLIQE